MKKRNYLFLMCLLLVLGTLWFYRRHGDDTDEEKVETAETTGLKMWGDNYQGQLGTGVEGSRQSTPVGVKTGLRFKKIAMGFAHVVALTETGEVWVWGNNENGQTGVGTEEPMVRSPRRILEGVDVVDVAARLNHSLALTGDGKVIAWGLNYNGQLGTGDFEDKRSPMVVEGIDSVMAVAAGYRFSLALKNDGSVWAWGGACAADQVTYLKELQAMSVSLQQLGGYHDPYVSDFGERFTVSDCTNLEVMAIKSLRPIRIEGLENIRKIDAGYGHILAVDTDGQVWARGCNTYGQVGRKKGTSVVHGTVQLVAGLPKVRDIAAGFRHSMVLGDDGSVWMWGYAQTGEFGGEHLSVEEAAAFTHTEPFVVEGLSNVRSISAGHDLMVAVDEDGGLWGWGSNHYGLFGSVAAVFEPRELFKDVAWEEVYLGGSMGGGVLR